jgi:hypothetical protein
MEPPVKKLNPRHSNKASLDHGEFSLSSCGNPEIRTLFNLLHGVGLRLSVTPEQVVAKSPWRLEKSTNKSGVFRALSLYIR